MYLIKCIKSAKVNNYFLGFPDDGYSTSAKPQKYFQLLSTFLPFFYCQQGRKDGQAMQA